MSVAIITGASAGLGTEYVNEIFKKFPEVDEFWLIARRKERLDDILALYPNKKIVPIPLDLTKENSYKEVLSLLEINKPNIEILVNCAGFGTLGDFDEIDYQNQMEMVDLNCRALTVMSRIILPFMSSGSFIVNVCSIASFAPTPRMAVYCSTKAYVLSLSKALRYELKERKINVLAVCPGPMSTEFLEVAKITGNSKMFDTIKRCSVGKVASKSLVFAKKGKAVYTPEIMYKFYRLFSKILPHNWIMPFTKV